MLTVDAERRMFAEHAVPLRTREQWGARHTYRMLSTDLSPARPVVEPAEAFFLHIAVVHDRSDLLGAEDQVMRGIEAIGRARFGSDSGSAGVSYNAAVFNTARFVYEGQPLGRRGAHTVNDKLLRTCNQPGCPNRGRTIPRGGGSTGNNLNVNVRAMTLPQNVNDQVTDGQVELIARWAAAQIVSGAAKRDARWHGHRCVSSKSCPGDPGWAALPRIQTLTDRYVTEGFEPMPTLDEIRKAVREELADVGTNVWSADVIPNDSANVEKNPNIRASAALQRLLTRTRDDSAVLRTVAAEVASLHAAEPEQVVVEQVVVTTGKPLPAVEIVAAAAAAGFTAEELPTAVAIALAESGGYPKAVGGPNSNGSYDCGLWQINDVHQPSQAERFDPLENAKRARRVYLERRSTWQPWSVFNSGSYRKHLAAAEAAVNAYNLRSTR